MQLHHKTPTLYSHALSQKLGKDIWFKMDCHQPTGSFKVRGVGQLCIDAAKNGSKKFVIASGGNAGLATAFAGHKLHIPTTVIVPSTTPENAIQKIKSLGATVRIFGEDWNDSNTYALSMCKKENATYIHPFDHPSIWQGNATAIDECAIQIDEPDLIITAVGGGGYFSGIIKGIEDNNWSKTKVATAETEGAASMHDAILAQKLITLDKIDTIASTLGAKRVAQKAFDDALQHQVSPFLVTDRQALNACQFFLDEMACLVEPSCGAALAAVYHNLPIIQEAQSILVMVCGGGGMSLQKLNELIKSV